MRHLSRPMMLPMCATWQFGLWHANCITQFTRTQIRKKEPAMLAINAPVMYVNPLFLRHDLMIEVGRLEMAIEDIRQHRPANEAINLVSPLETRLARITEA